MPLSGKTILANQLQELGYTKIDMGDVVRKEMQRRKIPVEKTSEFVNEQREEKGMDAIAKLTLEYVQDADAQDVVITGMRSLEEKKYLEDHLDSQIKVIAIWSSKQTRKKRRKERMREEDQKGQDFNERDQRELQNGIGNLIALSDFMIQNENKSIEELQKKVKEIVKQ